MIDFIDFDGFIKEMPNLNNKDYAINLLVPTSSYTILKIEFDPNTNGKQYVPLINEAKLNASMISEFNFVIKFFTLFIIYFSSIN